MVAAANMVEVAALVGDTARATMLAALMGGESLTGSELAFLARVSRPTASEHLAKLVAPRLVTVNKKRRFSYYRIASPLVARMLESIITVAAIEVPPRHQPRSAQDERLRVARTCFDHLAGWLGVAIADALVAKGCIILDDDGGEVTDAGRNFFCDFGVDVAAKARSRRIFCRPCLDWSERRYHVAGHVGAEMCRRCFELGWLARERDTRAVSITPAGNRAFQATFGLSFDRDEQDRSPQERSEMRGSRISRYALIRAT
ncbi:MAG: helix-turn-helix transcriptional regulator [Bradyrhizobiaceae bacterium]|nr:helix-turn-helix transcriptional regulator [Bradyrhizobiaceae bacterium]